jgi:hypothetical protein
VGTFLASATSVKTAALVALSKSLAKQTADLSLEPGLYRVDELLTIHVQGVVSKAADTEFSPPVEVPLVELLACALEKCGADRKTARSAIELALPVVLSGYRPRNSDRIRDAEDAIDQFKATKKADQPKKARAGATKCEVELAILETEAASIVAA